MSGTSCRCWRPTWGMARRCSRIITCTSSNRSAPPPASGLRIITENWFRHCRTRPGGADEDRSSETSLASALSDYFTDHLPRLRGTSPHTIHSYRDSMVLLLRFLSQHRSKPVTALDLADLAPPAILAFLSYLEQERNNGVSTRNVRLSAIHAFFHFVASRNPEHLDLAQRILGIPFKRARQRAIDYLEYDEIDAVLKAINRTTPQGSRDYALLATMFNTGGRVQEIADLRVCDLQLTKPFQVRLFGKGKKGTLLSAVAADGHGVASVLSAAKSGPALGISRLSESSRPAVNPIRNPLYPRPMSWRGRERGSESPEEATASSQRSAQHSRSASEIGSRSIHHKPSAGSCQSDNYKPLRKSRSGNEATGHRQGQASPTPVPHPLGQRSHDP